MKKFIGMLTALCLVLTPCAGAAALDSSAPTQSAAVTLEQLLNVTSDQFTPIVHNGTVYLPIQLIGEFLSRIFSWSFTGSPDAGVTTPVTTDPGTSSTTPVSSGQTTGAAVTLEQAKAIALKDAGFTESQVTIVRAWQDYDDGRLEYEIEFYKDNVEYDYEIDAATGKILSRDYDAEGYAPVINNPTTSSGSAVTLDQAKAIALKDAGFTESQVTIVRAWQDYDDGRLEYEIEFYKDNVEYDYEIDAATGKILSRDYDAEGYAPAQTGNAMSMDKAKQLVLNQVPGATVNNIVQFKLDYDDGRQMYEGKLFYNGLEYEFEMDAVTGMFYEWEIDR